VCASLDVSLFEQRSRVIVLNVVTWLTCSGPWADSRALISPSDISSRKPVTPSRDWLPGISGSEMIGFCFAALNTDMLSGMGV